MKVSVILTGGERSLARFEEYDGVELIVASLEEGVRRARGDVVAVLSARYRVPDGWLPALQREHAAGASVVAGCVAPAPGLSYFGWCVYLAEYSHLAPPMAANRNLADPKLIAAGNVSYVRSLATRLADRADFDEVAFHDQLRREGARLCLVPDMEVQFAVPPDWPAYLKERFRRSRAFAGAHSKTMGRVARPARACATLALPALILFRIFRDVQSRRRYRACAIGCLPVLAVMALVQTAGEICGYVFPKRKTAPEYT